MFEIYMNIPGRPAAGRPGPGRPAAGWQRLICKKLNKKLRRGPWRTGRPTAGAAGRRALAAPPRGDRPPQPYIRCWLPLTPSFASLKIQKKKKREGGRERRGEGEEKRRSTVGFSSRRL